ncbi:MAG: hypothetical protein ACOY4F_15570 [Thermodesulfobacteriota bacterium]
MSAWAQTDSAWVAGAGAWQPAGVDQEVAACGLPLTLVAPAAVASGWMGVGAGSPAMVLAGQGAGISIGQAARAATGIVRASCGPAAVGLDMAVLCAGTGGVAVTAHTAAFQDPAWREYRAGHSIAAVSRRAVSRPATGAVLASALGLPVKTA